MATLETSLDVCDFCYSYHQCYAKGQPFNFAKKEGVAKCSLCKTNNVMCIDCYKNSATELKNSILAKYGFVICRKCIVEHWRTTDIQERIEGLARIRIAEAQEKLRTDVYHLTETLQGQE